MEVQARSFRGFTITGRGVSQAAVDQVRAEIEALLEKHGVTAAEIDNLANKYRDLGESGVDLKQLGRADYAQYGINPKHVRANKHLHEVLKAARQLGAVEANSVVGFKIDPVHA